MYSQGGGYQLMACRCTATNSLTFYLFVRKITPSLKTYAMGNTTHSGYNPYILVFQDFRTGGTPLPLQGLH